jgi:predicted N-acetyltransferase YhbS
MAYSVLQADIDKDQEILTQLLQRNFGFAPEARFEWIYKNSPSGYPTCLLLQHTETGTIVGSLSLFPRTISIDGKSVQALITGDLVVDKEHRAIGPALKLVKSAMSMCNQNISGILFGISNANSYVVVQRSGFEILDDICEMTLVLSTYSYIRRLIPFSFIARPLSFLLDFALRVRDKGIFKRSKRNYAIDFPRSFNERFDELWEKQSKKYSFIGERSSRFLEWRFNQSPYHEYKVFTLAYPKEMSFLGYVVFYVDGKKIYVADLGFDGTEKSFTELISSFSLYQRGQGAESVSLSIASQPELINLLRHMGYSIRSKERKFLIYVPAELKAILKSIKNGPLFLTSADNDV